MRVYPYRTTTEKLSEHHASITASGHNVKSIHYVGGRDWVLICEDRGGREPFPPVEEQVDHFLRRLEHHLRRETERASEKLDKTLAKLTRSGAKIVNHP